MYPYFLILGKSISSYAVMAAVGIFFSIAVLFFCCRHYAKSFDDAVYVLAFTFLGILAGSRLLFVIVNVPAAGLSWELVLGGGFVFWGGFIGGWIAARLAARYFRLDISEFYPVLVPSVVLFAGFGRIGCFLTGCCYGCESQLFGICLDSSPVAPHGVPLMPVQLMEAGFDFILAAHTAGRKDAMTRYAVSYALFRFLAEFLRGDAERGFIGVLSVSQVISMGVLAFTAVICLRKKRNAARSSEDQMISESTTLV